MGRLTSVVIVALLASGCASLRPAPITNTNLNTIGRIAIRAAQVVNAIDIAQQQVKPLVVAEVISPDDGLVVAKAFTTALEQARNLQAILTAADVAAAVVDKLQGLQRAKDQVKALLRTITGSTTGIASLAGRIVVGSITGGITDAIGELGPEVVPAGGVQ